MIMIAVFHDRLHQMPLSNLKKNDIVHFLLFKHVDISSITCINAIAMLIVTSDALI